MRRVAGSNGTCIIGDPPRFPIAYHVLTTALLRLAGRPMACAERAMAALQAPNGDIAWSGRSYLQSWTLSAEAYLFTRVDDPMRAGRAVTRLESDTYRIGGRHLRLNPCNCRQDPYAQRPVYEGLTAWWLSLAGNATAGDPQPEIGGTSLDSTLYRVEATPHLGRVAPAGRRPRLAADRRAGARRRTSPARSGRSSRPTSARR